MLEASHNHRKRWDKWGNETGILAGTNAIEWLLNRRSVKKAP
jgi:hypothetical protein